MANGRAVVDLRPNGAGSDSTVTEVLCRWADERPDDVVAVERHGARRALTIAELVARADALAAGLADAGASAERPIVLWLPNRLEWLETFAAAARLGVPVVALNTRYRADELRHVLDRSHAGVLVVVDEFAGTRYADVVAAAGADTVTTVVVVDGSSGGWDDAASRVVAWERLGRDRATLPAPQPADLVAAFTTSGTTGFPKLAAHDQRGVVAHARDVAFAFDVRPGDRMLIDLPLCGVFGFTSLVAAVAGRATSLLDERFDPLDTAHAVASEGVTHYNASDDMLLRVLDAGVIRAGAHAWREGAFANFVNAAQRVAERAEHELGVRLTGVYGMSEVFALLARWPSALAVGERARAGGIAVGPELEVRVIDPDSGTERAIGQDGELCFRGPAVLACYLGDPAATDAALAPDGWFRSGDLGRLTRDGGFEYLARLGDSLRLRGFLVDPAEIERIIELHPAVDVAQVVGVEREAVGHVAVAFVRAVEPLTVDVLRTHCASRIAAFKVPAAFVFVEEFPTVAGPNGVKIRKRELRDLAAHVLAGDGGEAS